MTSWGWKPELCLLLLATWARPLLSSHRRTCPGSGWQRYKQPIRLLRGALCSHAHWLSYHKQSTEKNSESYERSHQKGKYPSRAFSAGEMASSLLAVFTLTQDRCSCTQCSQRQIRCHQLHSYPFPCRKYKLEWAEGTLNSASPHEILDRKFFL